MNSRRNVALTAALAVAFGGGVVGSRALATPGAAAATPSPTTSSSPGARVAPTMPSTPGGQTYEGELKNGVRVFALTAIPVRQQIATFPIRTATVWGWKATPLPDRTASTPGPTLVAHEGEAIQFVVTNRLPQPTSLHPHGTHQPNADDGVSGVDFQPIAVHETRTYPAYTPAHAGTFAYHTHTSTAVQEPRGLVGQLIVLPKDVAAQDNPAVDLAMTLQEFNPAPDGNTIREGALVSPEANQRGGFPFFTINGKTGDASGSAIRIPLNALVQLRLYNASGMTHSMHLHGQDMKLVDINGHPTSPQSVTTKAVSPGEFFTLQFRAVNPGVWAFHCSFPMHQANAMKSGYNGAPVGMLRLFQIGNVPPPPAAYFGPPNA